MFVPVVAFAELTLTEKGRLPGSFTDGTNTHFGIFDTTQAQDNFIANAINSGCVILSPNSDGYTYFYFINFTGNVTYQNDFLKFTDGGEQLTYRIRTTDIGTYPLNIRFYEQTNVYTFGLLSTRKLLSYPAEISNLPIPSNFKYSSADYDGTVAVHTSYEGEAPPEPPEPPKPEIPLIPEIPKIDNEYVPYDTSKWNGFLLHISKSIGSSTNIGFKIFGIILGIYVIIRVIKKFTK